MTQVKPAAEWFHPSAERREGEGSGMNGKGRRSGKGFRKEVWDGAFFGSRRAPRVFSVSGIGPLNEPLRSGRWDRT
jgi:hypothetical protein